MSHINENQKQALKYLYDLPASTFVAMASRFHENGDLRLLKLTGFVRQRIGNHGATFAITQKGRTFVEDMRNVNKPDEA